MVGWIGPVFGCKAMCHTSSQNGHIEALLTEEPFWGCLASIGLLCLKGNVDSVFDGAKTSLVLE